MQLNKKEKMQVGGGFPQPITRIRAGYCPYGKLLREPVHLHILDIFKIYKTFGLAVIGGFSR